MIALKIKGIALSMEFIKPALAGTFTGLAGILGLIFGFGILLFSLSRLTRHIYHRAGYPWLDVYVTGWIGTPVHELGHAFFCLIFRHRIESIKLFSPGSDHGSLGYVHHSYNRKSIYQNIGSFFISTGPLIFGTFLIYVLMYLLIPDYAAIISNVFDSRLAGINIFNIQHNFPLLFSSGVQLMKSVFSTSNFSSWEFYLFLYFSACISSHMSLSPQDLKGMWRGLALIVLLVFILNLAAALFSFNLTNLFLTAGRYAGLMTGLFIFASAISMLNFIFSCLMFGAVWFVRNKLL